VKKIGRSTVTAEKPLAEVILQFTTKIRLSGKKLGVRVIYGYEVNQRKRSGAELKSKP